MILLHVPTLLSLLPHTTSNQLGEYYYQFGDECYEHKINGTDVPDTLAGSETDCAACGFCVSAQYRRHARLVRTTLSCGCIVFDLEAPPCPENNQKFTIVRNVEINRTNVDYDEIELTCCQGHLCNVPLGLDVMTVPRTVVTNSSRVVPLGVFALLACLQLL